MKKIHTKRKRTKRRKKATKKNRYGLSYSQGHFKVVEEKKRQIEVGILVK